MALLTTWPAYTDDTGTKTDGTPIDEALLDAIKAAIIADIESATNPGVAPKTIADEVIAARGSVGSLDTRLDVALNEDGTLKSIAGQASVTDVAAAFGQRNLVRNSMMDRWIAGGSAAPDDFTLAGSGATVVRTGPTLADTTALGVGGTVAKVTSGGSAQATLAQVVIPTADATNLSHFKGKTVQAGLFVKCSTGSGIRLYVFDGTGTSYSDYHTGGGTTELLTVEREIAAGANQLAIGVLIEQGGIAAYMGGWMLMLGDVAPSQWALLGSKERLDAQAVQIFASNVTAGGNGAGAETDMIGVNGTGVLIPPGLLSRAGTFIRITAMGAYAANGNTKTIKMYLGSTSSTVVTGTTSGGSWEIEGLIYVIGSGDQVIKSRYLHTAPTIALGATAAAETESSALAVRITGNGTGASDVTWAPVLMELLVV